MSGIFGKNLMSALIISCELRVLVSASAQFRLFCMSIGFFWLDYGIDFEYSGTSVMYFS